MSSSNGASLGDSRSAKPVGSNQLLVELILNRPYESEVAYESVPMLPTRLLPPFCRPLSAPSVEVHPENRFQDNAKRILLSKIFLSFTTARTN